MSTRKVNHIIASLHFACLFTVIVDNVVGVLSVFVYFCVAFYAMVDDRQVKYSIRSSSCIHGIVESCLLVERFMT